MSGEEARQDRRQYQPCRADRYVQPQRAADTVHVVIHAGALIDGVTKAERRQVSIIIHDDRVIIPL